MKGQCYVESSPQDRTPDIFNRNGFWLVAGRAALGGVGAKRDSGFKQLEQRMVLLN